MTECKRCGKCCGYLVDGRWVECRHKRRLSNGTFFCAVYDRRLGLNIGNGYYCVRRQDAPGDYEGCPYNTNKPILR